VALSDNKIVGRDAEGKEVAMDWSKASAQNVTAAYGYVHDVMAAANANHVLSVIGIAATVSFGHGARHLAGTGLNQGDVEAAIQRDVQTGVRNATQPTGNFWGRVNVARSNHRVPGLHSAQWDHQRWNVLHPVGSRGAEKKSRFGNWCSLCS
jgi:hypothetical protein